ncbi:MAG TPA: DnaA regulatory inactivator Hda [Casimicrobiaceae bacterium]|nr:DnaA regulatory inactivator Hda [Casimicrobiaceae bacterium]
MSKSANAAVKFDACRFYRIRERRPSRRYAYVTEQLVFDLAASAPPSFANFISGRNAEAVATLGALAAGTLAEAGILLWGAPGGGKTHLLRATIRAAEERGAAAAYIAEPGALLALDAERLAAHSIVAVDRIDVATPDAQAAAFRLFNALKERKGHFVAASRVSQAALPLREDLRTRLGWGLVFEVNPLVDAEKAAALAAFAAQRGLPIGEDVISYLLARGRRDMPALLATLAALDRHSLASRRPITVPLLRDWLQRQLDLEQ